MPIAPEGEQTHSEPDRSEPKDTTKATAQRVRKPPKSSASAKRAVPPHESPYSKRARAAVSPLRVGDNTDGLAHRARSS